MHKKLKNIFFNRAIPKMYRFKTHTTQIGQGLIEYLLLLVFTVTIIIAVMNGMGKPVANYMNNIYSLVGCMLRVGEGPQIAFNLCGGLAALELDREALESGGSGSTGSGGGSNNNSSNDSADDGSSSGGDGSSNSDQSTNFTTPSTRGSIDGAGGRRGGNFNFGDGQTEPGQSNRIKINADEGGGDSSFDYANLGQETVIVRRIRRNGEGQIGGSFTLVGREEAINSGEAEVASPTVTKKKAPEGPETERRRVSSFTVSPEKSRFDNNDLNVESEGFSFMKMIKWGIIIAIIFIFGAFTLSQLNNIRKGWTE